MRAAQLRERIGNLRDLRGVVKAMRALAAARLRRADEGLAGARAYASAIRESLADAVAMVAPARRAPPPRSERRVVLMLGAEHGFTGGFHSELLDAAESEVEAGAELWIAGRRAQIAAGERDLPVSRSLDMATQWSGLETAIGDLASEITELVAGDRLTLALMHATRDGPVTTSTVVPLDPLGLERRLRGPLPLCYVDPETLLKQLTGEYIVAQLARAAIESFAAENRARLLAMDEAHRNIERRLADLEQQERQRRQAEITEELIEVVAGADVLLRERRD